MRLASVIVASAILLVAMARADVAKQYSGRIVMSPDPPPTIASELATYLKANATKDDSYEAIKGSPWEVHLVGVLSADAKAVTLEFVDDSKKPLHTLEVSSKRRLVLATAKLTTAAGFEANKTYLVRFVDGKKTLAKATLRLRD